MQRFRSTFSSLSYRNFRLLWLGNLAESSASQTETIALNWLVWELTGSAFDIGLVNLSRYLPLVIFSLIGGVAADRFEKRRLLLFIQVWSLASYTAMAVLVQSGSILAWHIYVVSALLGIGKAIEDTVRTSYVSDVVESGQILNALSLNSIAVNSTRLAVPALVGLLIELAGIGPAYFVCVFFYILLIQMTIRIQAAPPHIEAKAGPLARELTRGISHVLKDNRTALLLLIMSTGPLAIAYSYRAILPVFTTNVLHMGPLGFGALQSMGGVGALVGGLTLASGGEIKNQGRIMIVAGFLYGLALIALGGFGLVVLAFGFVMAAAASQAVYRASNNSLLLQVTPPALRGRVVSMNYAVNGLHPIGAILAGAVTDAFNVSVGFIVLGVICLAIVMGVALMKPGLKSL